MSAPTTRIPFVPLALLAALVLATWSSRRPPAPLAPADPMGRFSGAAAYARLGDLLSEDVPHPVASAANARVRARLLAQLKAAGLKPVVRPGFSCDAGACSQVENVLATIGGRAKGPGLLVVSHYDSRASAPGAGDDGSGVAVATEAASMLVTRPPPRDVTFLFTDGEEGGLHGARVFLRDARPADYRAMINLEARGTGGPSMMFETSPGDARLVGWLAAALTRPVASSVYPALYRFLPNTTDFTVLGAAGMRGVNFAFLGNPGDYHTPRDRLANLSPASLQHHGQGLLQLIDAADALGPRLHSMPPGDAIFFDLLGLRMVTFPAGAAPLGAALALLGLLVQAGRRARRAGAGPGRVAGALAGQLAVALVVALAAFGSHRLLIAAGALPARWVAYPGFFLGSQVVLGALGAACGGAWLATRFGRGAAFDAHWISLAAVGVAVGLTVPGASYPFWIPALVAAAVAGRVALGDHEGHAGAAYLPWVVFLTHFLPLALALYEGLGARIPGLFGVVAWLVFAPVGAEWAGAGRRVGVAVVALGAGFFAAALAVPAFSPAVPCPLTFRYLDAVGGRPARVEVLTPLAAMPPALAAAARFEPTGHVYHGLHDKTAGFAAPAEAAGLDAPAVSESSLATDEPGGSRWTFLLKTRRGARRLGVTLPPASGVTAVWFRDQRVFPFDGGPPAIQPTDLVARVPPGEALAVRLELAGDAAPTIEVWDVTDDLPPVADPLVAARPAWAIPAHDADHTRVGRMVVPPAR